ncbi:MAG: LysE family translocator [Caulobacter sp.]|nr:LysE family translocator [Caulobacter sp.]
MPPDFSLLIPFVVAVLLVELTPGPNMGYLVVVSTRFGRVAGLATVVGVTAGLTVYLLAAVFGLGEVLLRVGWLYGLLRWAGVAYLLWLAWDTWRDDGLDAEGRNEPPPSRARLMGRGFLANVLNPKAAVFYVALLPGFTDPHRVFAPQALGLGLIHIAISVVIHLTLVLAAARAAPLVTADHPDGRKAIRAAFALALAAIAVWLAWSTRRG